MVETEEYVLRSVGGNTTFIQIMIKCVWGRTYLHKCTGKEGLTRGTPWYNSWRDRGNGSNHESCFVHEVLKYGDIFKRGI